MNFYSAIVTYKALSLPFDCDEDRKLTYFPSSDDEKRSFNTKLRNLNGIFAIKMGMKSHFLFWCTQQKLRILKSMPERWEKTRRRLGLQYRLFGEGDIMVYTN